MVSAQDRRFSPEKFEADLKGFIMKEASLTPQEADKFFPVFREMREKQRGIYDKMRKLGMNKPSGDEACKQVILEYDKLNLELGELDATYHKKMMKVLSPSKVYEVMKAEKRFHRQMMKGWQRGRHR
jgi:Spy/CpxP family protein refolding chaperone